MLFHIIHHCSTLLKTGYRWDDQTEPATAKWNRYIWFSQFTILHYPDVRDTNRIKHPTWKYEVLLHLWQAVYKKIQTVFYSHEQFSFVMDVDIPWSKTFNQSGKPFLGSSEMHTQKSIQVIYRVIVLLAKKWIECDNVEDSVHSVTPKPE